MQEFGRFIRLYVCAGVYMWVLMICAERNKEVGAWIDCNHVQHKLFKAPLLVLHEEGSSS